MNNGINNIENAIKSGQWNGPVYRYRVYTLINSATHLAAGAMWQLHSSWMDKTTAEAEAEVQKEGDLWFTVVIDGEAA